MVGRATLTIVASRMVMNIAATKTAPTATFWLIRGATASFPRGNVWPAASALQKLQDHARTGNSDAGPGLVPGAAVLRPGCRDSWYVTTAQSDPRIRREC